MKLLSLFRKIFSWVGLAFLISYVAFFVLLFRYSDLSELVSSLVARGTGGMVALRFQDLRPNFLVGSVTLSDVRVETPQLPTLRAGSLTLSPRLASLLTGRAGGRVQATDLFNGDLDLSVRQVPNPSQKDAVLFDIDLSSERMDLEQLTSTLPSPIPLAGRINLGFEIQLDPTMTVAPKTLGNSEVVLSASGPVTIKANTLTVNTMLGPLALSIPEIKLSRATFRGRLNENRLEVLELILGDDKKDPLLLMVRGEVGVQVSPGGAGWRVDRYDLKVRLDVQNQVIDEILGPFAMMKSQLEAYRVSAAPNRLAYMIGAQGTGGLSSPPRLRKINNL
jgi:type II secretion system protein N